MNNKYLEDLMIRYPLLKSCENDIGRFFETIVESFSNSNKLIICGNGGSAADADHIVGELMKGFKAKRHLNNSLKEKLLRVDSSVGDELGEKLQLGLPAIALHNNFSLNTAFANDVENGGYLTFAQQILNYGKKGDILLGISTSGNAKNIYYASVVAKALGIKVLLLSGKDGGLIKQIADYSIIVPCDETYIIQEYHLPIYHCLCLMIEDYFFSE